MRSTSLRGKIGRGYLVGTLFVVLCFSAGVSAQTIMSGALTGTLQSVNQDGGTITISGITHKFENSVTKVFYAGKEMDSAILDTGMVLRFIVNNNGVVERIEILGPAVMLRGINEH